MELAIINGTYRDSNTKLATTGNKNILEHSQMIVGMLIKNVLISFQVFISLDPKKKVKIQTTLSVLEASFQRIWKKFFLVQIVFVRF